MLLQSIDHMLQCGSMLKICQVAIAKLSSAPDNAKALFCAYLVKVAVGNTPCCHLLADIGALQGTQAMQTCKLLLESNVNVKQPPLDIPCHITQGQR